MAKPTARQRIADALAELDRADRLRVAADVAYEEAERAVFRTVGAVLREFYTADGPALDDVAGEELDEFMKARGISEEITYRDAMARGRDPDWMAGRDPWRLSDAALAAYMKTPGTTTS